MTEGGDLKQGHGLYVGFAFAAADVLFELSEAGIVEFAVGAALKLLGRPARRLQGMAFADLLAPSSRPEAERALTRMVEGARVRRTVLLGLREDGSTVSLEISGYRRAEDGGHLLVAMSLGAVTVAGHAHRIAQSGLLDGDGFRTMANSLVQSAAGGQPYRLSMIDLPEIDRLRAEAGSDVAQSFVGELGARLRALSVGGDAAGQLSDNRYCVLHPPEVDSSRIEEAVGEAALAVEQKMHAPGLSTLVLDVAEVPPDDIPHVLAYALNRFTQGGDTKGGLAALAADLQPRLSAAVKEMRAVREVIERGEFNILYQPIVDLWTGVVHHFECLLRFSDDNERSPYLTVTFAEDTGLAGEIDLAVAERVISAMRVAPLSHPSLKFAINLSGRSLSDPTVVRRLKTLLGEASATHHRRLMLEITESAEIRDFPAVNAVVQDFRGMGYSVCLDDFGAGNAAFHYLRALGVDHVKIDGSYVHDCVGSAQAAAFIRAIVGLCNELGISTIAEYVENIETVNLLRVLKVRFGQGYLFGKPMRPRPAAHAGDLKGPWLTATTEWRNDLLHWRGVTPAAGSRSPTDG